MKKIYRNGDWQFIETKNKVLKTKALKHNGSFTFAVGGATAHTHTISVKKKDDMVINNGADDSFIVALKSKAIVTHPEHSLKNDLVVEKGVYTLTQKREKDWFSLTVRKIID